jgi:nicotinamide mononucleotide (NMN) deamidase PncC
MVQELESSIEVLIKDIHAHPTKCVLVATGGAVQASSWLLSVPGASNTILEVVTPYARESLVSMLGSEPEQYCSQGTAVNIAKQAYRRAAELSGLGTSFVGVGATCALASVPLKRGEHRAFLACHGSFGTRTVSITLAKVRH